MLLDGTKDEHFSCFHSSCQLEFMPLFFWSNNDFSILNFFFDLVQKVLHLLNNDLSVLKFCFGTCLKQVSQKEVSELITSHDIYFKSISQFVIFGSNSKNLWSEKKYRFFASFTYFSPQNSRSNRFLNMFFFCRMSLKISQETEEAQIITKKIMTDFSKFS